MDFKIAFVLCLFVVPSYATFHKFFSGECPHVASLPIFNIDRFLGQWYVIENYNDNAVLCLRENFTAIDDVTEEKKEMPDMARNELEHEKDLEQVYQVKRSYLSFGGRQMIHETGRIKFVSNTSHSEMEINYPYTETGMLNMKHYQVVATDYDRYALIWRCQRTIFGHRRAAQIMSRKATIEQKTLLELQTMLKAVELNDSVRLNEVSQANCDQPLSTARPIRTKPSKDQTPLLTDLEKPEPTRPNNSNKGGEKNNGKNQKKLISIDVGGFHLSIMFPFW